VLDHIGRDFLFDKAHRHRKTIPLVEGLPAAPPAPPTGPLEPEKLKEGVRWRFGR
jgi:hypothetical protein